jgi:hypothetical protein
MTTYTIDENTRLEVTFNRETITVDGYEWVDAVGLEDDDSYEPAGVFLTHTDNYSGYTMSECLCKALIDMDKADDWDDAIYMIEAIGVEYVTDEEDEGGEA